MEMPRHLVTNAIRRQATPVKQRTGTLFRSLLAGALLGGAMGTESRLSGRIVFQNELQAP